MKACQCYGHSKNCTYDPEVDRLGLSLDIHGNYEGGGVCHNCQVSSLFLLVWSILNVKFME